MTKPSHEQHEQIDMKPIYEKYPILAKVEARLDPRFDRRRSVLDYIPRYKRGAEIGVFTGQFSELIVQVAKPASYYAVDPWFASYGTYFPNWGEYSANGTLETKAGYEATKHRLARFPGINVIPMPAVEWLDSLVPNSLDWAYVDSTHQYEPTLKELTALAAKLTLDGILLGDDCWAARNGRHYGVFRAVRDFCRACNFELISLDHSGQWVARRTID